MFLLDRFRRKRENKAAAERLLHSISVQSRSAEFYGDSGIADTLDGRFELIVLHAVLIFRRLRDIKPNGETLADLTFHGLLNQLDYGLREDGASDHTIARKIRTLAESYLGRARAYDSALESGDKNDLITALDRNLTNVISNDNVPNIVSVYVLEVVANLQQQTNESLLIGQIDWPELVAFKK